MAKLSLSAVVTIRKGDNARAKFVSFVLIKLGGKTIASKTLGGRYNAEQAVAEFRRNPKGWTPDFGQTVDMLETSARLAA